MIDWYFVTVHTFWILGLAIVLAAFSWHDWERRERGRPLQKQLRLPSFHVPLSGGLLLVAISFLLMESSRWWEHGVVGALGVSFLWSTWAAWRAAHGSGKRGA